ncbi:MAG: putative glycoside hydrolase, partial [Chloroflexota bacterium]
MSRRPLFLFIAIAFVVTAALAVANPSRVPVVAQLTGQYRPGHKLPTITTLPDFPGIPLYAPLLSRPRQLELIQAMINHKVSTWPAVSSRSYRAGKFTSTGIFGGFRPTEAQIARIAPNYDNILFGAANSDLIPRFQQYNPDLTFFIYVDSGLNPGFEQSDAGSVDDQDAAWIIQNHPDWILKDQDGNFIRSGGGLSNPGEYWPDPGNPEWQAFFAEKVTKLLADTGGQWDGVLLDQFIGTADGYVRYAQAAQQVAYPTDEAFQAATLDFLTAVAAHIPVPLIVNMEGGTIIRRPAFVAEVALAAGGAENEIFPEEMPSEDLRPYLETVQGLPPAIHIRINSKPADWAGDVDDTLFAYYCYLLIADRNREVYWTNKEGTSDVPHYWYREFDLNLGPSQGNIHFGDSIWSREFENALVLVNPGQEPAAYAWPAARRYYDV